MLWRSRRCIRSLTFWVLGPDFGPSATRVFFSNEMLHIWSGTSLFSDAVVVASLIRVVVVLGTILCSTFFFSPTRNPT
jgi:hypothetical protein